MRTAETNLGNLVAEALLASYEGADVAITNGGGIRASIDAGDITMGKVLEVRPFTNYGVAKRVTGRQLQEAVEFSLSKLPEQNGGFPQIAGMTVVFDSSAEAGKRVVEIKIGGEALDPEKQYVLVTNDFLAAGGDDFTMLIEGETLGELPLLSEMLISYLAAGGISSAVVDGRLTDNAAQEQTPAA